MKSRLAAFGLLSLVGAVLFFYFRERALVDVHHAPAPIPRASLLARMIEPTVQTGANGSAVTLPSSTASDADPPAFPEPPLPRYKPRAAGEWEGMPIDLATTPPCESRDGCGLARACIRGVCTACEQDGDCDSGEACVLDHCVRAERVGCRHTGDCQVGSTCLLSGYSPEPRGNESMDSHCVSPQSGQGKAELMKRQPPLVPDDPRRDIPFRDELARARAAFK